MRTSLQEVIALQPGLARLMPEIGDRWWKCYYAVMAGSWSNAKWQLRESDKLLRLCQRTRPKYIDDIDTFMEGFCAPLHAAIDQRDKERFISLFHAGVDEGNRYHEVWKKGHILWELPPTPPPSIRWVPDDPSSPV